jgi:hypothetical protein
MKRLRLLTALAIGIMASTSGVVQVKAANFNYFVDFSTKEVINFDDYKQTFIEDTYGLNNFVTMNWVGSYKYDSCPTTFTQSLIWRLYGRVNNSGTLIELAISGLPDFVCTTTYTQFFITQTAQLSSNFLDLIVDDDANFLTLISEIGGPRNVAVNRTLYLAGYLNYFELSYDFNTTYLFNYFLSDVKYNGTSASGITYNPLGTKSTQLDYLFTTAGNDQFFLRNTNTSSIGTTRKKYAVDYNQEYFRGESIGAGFTTGVNGVDELIYTLNTGSFFFSNSYNYYYLNTSNLSQAIVDAPIFEFEEEDCGSFLALNVGCFINNAFAYITNDAPIVSDAFTLLNAGIEMAAQTFGIIGEFADDNVFGVMILAGFGFIAVKWFLKND